MEVDANMGYGVSRGGAIGGSAEAVCFSVGLFSGDAPSPVPAMVPQRHRIFMKSGVTVAVTEDILQRHFACYGNVTDVYIPRIMPDHTPKGFAYISFDSEEAVHRVLELESHEIDGKHFPVGKAEPRPFERGIRYSDQGNQRWLRGYNHAHVQWGGFGIRPIGNLLHYPPLPEIDSYIRIPGAPTSNGYENIAMKRNVCRIFVGGVPDVLSEVDVKIHFEKYGRVEDVYFPKEKDTSRRGFCYVRFDNPNAANTAAACSSRTIGGNKIGEIKIAQPRPGESLHSDFYHNRNCYPIGGCSLHKTEILDNSTLFEGRPRARFYPY